MKNPYKFQPVLESKGLSEKLKGLKGKTVLKDDFLKMIGSDSYRFITSLFNLNIDNIFPEETIEG